MIHAFVFDAVNELDFCAAAVHSEHPTNDYRAALTVKLFVVYFAFINLNRTCQYEKGKNVFFDVVAVGFADKFEILIRGLNHTFGTHVYHTSGS